MTTRIVPNNFRVAVNPKLGKKCSYQSVDVEKVVQMNLSLRITINELVDHKH